MATSIKRSKGSQSSTQIGTFSFWIKRTKLGSSTIYSNTVENDNNRGYFEFSSDDFRTIDNDASGTHFLLVTDRKFRDFSAWYHIVLRIDTTQSTANDRVRVYVNGVQETSFSTNTQPSQNENLKLLTGGQTDREYINRIYGGSAGSHSFYLSHFHFTDGQSYGPDSFGSTDANTGEWIINPSPSVTYGNQGWFLFKDDASLNDDSGVGNNWSSDSGTVQKSEDNPSNNFAIISAHTGNPLELQVGGLKSVTNNGETSTKNPNFFTTLGYNTGKFYWETKISTFSTGSGHSIGVIRTSTGHIPVVGNGATDTGQSISNGDITLKFGEATPYIKHYGNNVQSGSVGSFSSGDIVACSHDLSAGEFKFYKNGSQIGTTITSMSSSGDGYMYFPQWTFESKSSGRYCTMEWNMGNGFFGTTAVSSAGTNASNLGIFEYDVPANHSALCTKGLNL